MEFKFETYNDHASLTAVAKAIRKIYRRRSSFVTRLILLIAVIGGTYLSVASAQKGNDIGFNSLICYIMLLLGFVAALWEDGVNGFLAQMRIPASSKDVEATFDDEHYVIETELARTSWQYQSITHLAETKYFFVFIFNQNHAQVFDKEYLEGGTEEEFKDFIFHKTGKTFQKV